MCTQLPKCSVISRIARSGHVSAAGTSVFRLRFKKKKKKKKKVVSAVQVHFSLHYRLKKITGSNALRAVVQPAWTVDTLRHLFDSISAKTKHFEQISGTLFAVLGRLDVVGVPGYANFAVTPPTDKRDTSACSPPPPPPPKPPLSPPPTQATQYWHAHHYSHHEKRKKKKEVLKTRFNKTKTKN